MSDLFTRMRLSAFSRSALQAFFGTDFLTFRFFDTDLIPGQETVGTCCIVTSVSQLTEYLHNGRNPLTGDRVQFDIIDKNKGVATAAAAAIDTWLESVNFVDNREFILSPVRASGGPPPNFKLNQRGGTYAAFQLKIPLQMLDYRISNVNT